jgi:2-keto-4-pentenoate hydratase/2-oxohepta-3-ene-1,7-dioic acid hydratase in catechol pathway
VWRNRQYFSTVLPLMPGDVIVSGTCVGSRREPPLWMKAGDVCAIEISPIVAEA